MVDISRTDFKNKFFGSGTLGTNLKPIVGQNYLNEKFYEGYQMPIVVMFCGLLFTKVR